MNSVIQRTLVLHASRRTVDRRLFPGRVMRVIGDCEAVLTAREGMLWITFDESRVTRPGPWGDYFLKPGQGIVLHEGEQVVLSAADARHGSALFDMTPLGGREMPRRNLVGNLLSTLARWLPTPRGMAAA